MKAAFVSDRRSGAARSLKTIASVVAATVVLIGGLAGCGAARSAEAFCDVMAKHKDAYLQEMQAAQGGNLDGLLTAISAVGELKLMWKELADVAPSDIQADAEAVRDAWAKQEDNAASGDWMASVSTALLNSGSMTRVDAYVREHCDGGVDSQGASSSTDGDGSASGPTVLTGILTDQWTNDLGYTYELNWDSASVTTGVDIANALPGKANVTWSYSFVGYMMNTTPGRTAPAPNGFKIMPVWAGDSPVCSATSGVQPAFASNMPGMEQRWCTLMGFPYTLTPQQSALPEGRTIELSTGSVLTNSFSVPEDHAGTFEAALKTPTLWAYGRDEGGGLRTGCLLASGGYYLAVATGDTGCTS